MLSTISTSLFAQKEMKKEAKKENANREYNLDDIYANNPELKPNRFREILNRFMFSFSAGYEATFYNTDLSSQSIYLAGSKNILIGDADNKLYKNWLNAPEYIGEAENFPNYQKLETNGQQVVYKGVGSGVPIDLNFNYLFGRRFRAGLGLTYATHRLKKLSPESNLNGTLIELNPEIKSAFFKYYLTLGAELYHYKGFTYVLDMQFGKTSLGKGFSKDALERSMTINVGMPIERVFSEYFRVFIRPSYEFKNYQVLLPESTSTLKTSQNAFAITLGVKIRIPEIKRCPIHSCETQMKHAHGDQAYRGQPLVYPQNPKIGQIPKTLQNYRRKDKAKFQPRPAGM